jgi:hypothetical protein
VHDDAHEADETDEAADAEPEQDPEERQQLLARLQPLHLPHRCTQRRELAAVVRQQLRLVV